MTERDASAGAPGLSPEVRHALLELVEHGVAAPDHFRTLAAAGTALASSKGELLAALDRRMGEDGLTVTSGTLTNLSVINQIYGFALGDLLQELIRATAELVLRAVDPEALVTRIAGAQFVILHGITDRERVTTAVRALQTAFNTVALNRHRRLVAPRVAMVSLEVPDDDELDATEVIKILGYSQLRSRPSHLDPVILSREVDHRGWRATLRKRETVANHITDALRRRAVEIHFQPVIELATRNLYNVEVLARIRTEDGDVMTATEFIDSVYQLGEIVALDSQVFERLAEVGSQLAGVTGHLFINVSPVSLLSPDFLDLMSATMEKLRADGIGMLVVLELTEQAIVEHLDIIHELHARHDLKFAVDDFGTGYSSLKTVSDLAVSQVVSHLKLDGSLIREVARSREAYKVVLAVANLARSLDLKVVAEHVESEEVLERLRSIGVELGQGRLFDMPLPLPGLVESYGERAAPAKAPPRDRPHLDGITPYLDRVFTAFYDRLLSNDHFRAFFRDDQQIRSLVDRQRASFTQSLGEDEDELRRRYVALGQTHHELGVPFPTFMKGAEILNEELLKVLANTGEDGRLVLECSTFFRRLQNLLARGYLDGMLDEEETDLRSALDRIGETLSTARGPSIEWVSELVEAVRDDRHENVPRPVTAMVDAAEWLDERVSPLLPKDSARQVLEAYRALHADGDSLAFFLGAQEYPSVILLYRQLHDRVITMHRVLSEAGLA